MENNSTSKAAAPFTRGPVQVKELGEFGLVNIVGPDGKTSVAFTGVQLSRRSKLENEANAELIAEAFNVATGTGLTPRQLAEQRNELLTACKSLLSHGCIADAHDDDKEPEDRQAESVARAAIANAEKQP